MRLGRTAEVCWGLSGGLPSSEGGARLFGTFRPRDAGKRLFDVPAAVHAFFNEVDAGAGESVWLAVASLLLAGALAFHGPLAADLDQQMSTIAAAATRWAVAHSVAAPALALFAVAGLIALTPDRV